MTKNKKKLRRAERRYSVTKSAQTLVLAGILLAGGVTGAMAATWTGDNMTVDAGETLTVSSGKIDLEGTLTINGGTVTVTRPGSIQFIEGNGKASTILMQGGTLNVTGYSDALQLQITGGTTNITGEDGNAWGADGLGGYNEKYENSAAGEGDGPTTVSGAGTVVNIKNANLFGGAANNTSAGGLDILDGATVNLLGDKDANNAHNKDFDNAGMLAALGGAEADRILTISGQNTTVNVAAHQHGVFQAYETIIADGAAINVNGSLLLTGSLDGGVVSAVLGSADKATTTLEHGGLLYIASTGRVSLAPNMTLVLGEAGILDNKGLLTINTGATLHLIEGSDLTMEGSLTNAGTVLVNSSLDLRDSKGELTNTGTFKIVNKTTNLSAGLDADEQGRVTVTKAQFDKLREGKIILGDASATNHSRLSVWGTDTLTFNTSDFETSAPSAAGKIQMAKWGSLQGNSVTLNGNTLALGAGKYTTTVADNYSLARIKFNTVTLNSGSSDFTLTAGRLYVTGDMAGSALNVGDGGTKTLILNGGSLRLGDSETVIGGVVNGNVTVGGSDAGQFEVGSGAWDMNGNLNVNHTDSELVIGGDDDDGKPLTASLTLNGDLSITKGVVTVDETGTLTVQNLGVSTAAVTRSAAVGSLDIAAGGNVKVINSVTVNAAAGGDAMNVAGTLTAGSVSVAGTGTAVSVADGGTLKTDELTVDGTSTVAVNGTVDAVNAEFKTGTTTTVAQGGALTVTGDTKAAASSLEIENTGQLSVSKGSLANIANSAVNSEAGSTIKLTGTTEADEYAAGDLTGKLGSLGLIDVGDAKVTGLNIVNNKIAHSAIGSIGNIANAATKAAVVTDVDGATGQHNNLTGAWAGVELKSGSNALTVDNTLQLTGGADTNFLFVKDGTDLTKAAKVTVAAGEILTLGEAGTNKSGTVGEITLTDADSTLNVTGNSSAEIVVNGKIIATVDKADVNVNAAKLTVKGDIGASTNTVDLALTNGGKTTAVGGDIYVTDVNLGAGGQVKATKSTAGGNINVAGAVSGSGSINAAGDLTINKFNDGTTDGKVSNSTFIAGGDMTVSNNGISADNVKIQVTDGTLATASNGNIATTGKSYIEAKNVIINGSGVLALGGASTLKVTDTLTLGTGTNAITEGSVADVNKVDLTNNLTVGSTDESKGKAQGHLQATETTLGGGLLQVLNATASLGTLDASGNGKLFIDPAYVNIDGFAANTTVGSALLMGKEGVLTVGALDQAWVQKAIKDSGAATDSSVLGLQKTLTLAAGGTIVVDKGVNNAGAIGSSTVSKIHFGDKSLLALDGSKFLDDTKPAAIVGDGSHTFYTSNTNGEAAKLHITGIKTGDTVHVISGLANAAIDLDDDSKSWQNENITFDTQLFKGEGSTNTDKNAYTVNVKSVGAHNIFPQMSSSMSGLVDQVMGQYGLQTDSTNAGVRFVSRAVSDSYGLGGNNAEQAAATIEGAAQLAVVGAAPAMTLSAVQAGTSTVTTRTSFASPLMDSSKAVALHKDVDGTLSVDSGLNAGNGMKNGFGLWIMPLYQSNSAWGMKADGFKGGYKSDLGGVALGADYTFNDMFRLGLAFNIGGGYAESNGDFNKTENSFNFWGINAYGGWTMNNFGITADVGYTGNYNKLQQELPSGMGMSDIKSDVNSSAWTAGLRGEYKFATEALDIIPHVGVRYTGLTTDEYKAKSGGDTVFKVDQDFQSIWTFPIGVTLAKEIETGSGWIIRPQVDLGITPATGDVKAKSKVRIPGVDSQAEMKMQVVDYMSYDGGVGLEMKKDNISFGVNYNIQASEHRTGHGVFGTFRYEF